ncbi:hypothetical protein GAR05_04828 [Micromonospora saelicesensis]|uniref:Uncharacterized protein n=1 Tax=Micromonospora saelicesensis TaxID=285676 RepID=A0ABX9CDE2_9ACTN|nr:hypothetical protein GAR05_04828 [Micromonospora saelicesensis]
MDWSWLTADRASVFVAVGALVFSAAAWRTTRRGVQEATRQAQAAEVQATAARSQVTTAEQAVAVAKEQAKAARDQVELAERAVGVAQDQAAAAREQVELAASQAEQAEQARREQNRPYVFADIRGDEHQPQLLVLIARNQGPTLARRVRITLDPPLDVGKGRRGLSEWQISALPPGAQLSRPLTVGYLLIEGCEQTIYRVTIDADDRDGPIETLSYEIDLSALEDVGAYGKTIHHVALGVEKIANRLQGPRRSGAIFPSRRPQDE